MIALLLALLPGIVLGSFNFLAIGDWGGQDNAPYTFPGEIAAAAGMATISTQLQVKFVLGLGDNFYYSGIHGDASNFRFQDTFENVYKQPSLQVPWHLIAGNHDHGGNVTAQIAYSQKSKRWNFPDYYYSIEESFVDSKGVNRSIQLLMIDTVLLTGNNDHNIDRFAQPPGPDNVAEAETQWQWIEEQLSASSADFLWVAGHYPVWSGCEHGPTDVLVARLRPMLLKYRVTGYLSGHDHCLEYIDDGGSTKYVLTGAGMECCYSPTKTSQCPKNSIKFIVAGPQSPRVGPHSTQGIASGFASFRIDTDMTVVYHNQDGDALFTTPAFPPRK